MCWLVVYTVCVHVHECVYMYSSNSPDMLDVDKIQSTMFRPFCLHLHEVQKGWNIVFNVWHIWNTTIILVSLEQQAIVVVRQPWSTLRVRAVHYIQFISSVFSVPEFKCLDKKELLKIADVLQEVSQCSWTVYTYIHTLCLCICLLIYKCMYVYYKFIVWYTQLNGNRMMCFKKWVSVTGQHIHTLCTCICLLTHIHIRV